MTGFRKKLDQPARELSAGLGEFSRTHNSAAAGLSLLKLGEICRLQQKYPAAIVNFLTAIAEAETAGDKKTHASALIGEGRCELASTKDYRGARTHFREAAEIAASLSDRAPLFNALGWQAGRRNGDRQFDRRSEIARARLRACYPRAQRRESIAGAIEWQDVFLKKGDAQPLNISHCDGDNCGQPSLSGDGTRAVFIRVTS